MCVCVFVRTHVCMCVCVRLVVCQSAAGHLTLRAEGRTVTWGFLLLFLCSWARVTHSLRISRALF